MTAQAFAQTTPEWVSRISDEDLSRELGVTTFVRGAAYHRSDAVISLSASTGGVLVGGVRGSRGRRYHTIINAPKVRGRPAPSTWTSHCSCPMRIDCKHVVAVILEARGRLSVEEAPPPAPAWESAFEAWWSTGRSSAEASTRRSRCTSRSPSPRTAGTCRRRRRR